ncbi:hypothetical protein BC938DRAFT_478534 [Jimgerdemannia flammicorona]|uniref:Uncharacterized protein n=1 Tax=Jimgerdemannia flammicorona TaxID=994334 RepID=A0A433QYA8_9FUNG|nr:hypothetical protein BC938DRAFT_478534 [Jimgerdemannia flammicorona]
MLASAFYKRVDGKEIKEAYDNLVKQAAARNDIVIIDEPHMGGYHMCIRIKTPRGKWHLVGQHRPQDAMKIKLSKFMRRGEGGLLDELSSCPDVSVCAFEITVNLEGTLEKEREAARPPLSSTMERAVPQNINVRYHSLAGIPTLSPGALNHRMDGEQHCHGRD